jgi:hypothetical protein
LPDIRWHDLRHTCATLLLSRGTHPKYVQQLLDHASMQLTLDRYSHWMPSMGKHTASAMDDALEDSDDAPENEKEATWSVERPRWCTTGLLDHKGEPRRESGALTFPAFCRNFFGADERTRTAHLLITSEIWIVRRGSWMFANPHI